MTASTPIVLVQFDESVASGGEHYLPRACGRALDDGRYEGWIEFERSGGGAPLRSGRETIQPNLTDLRYWATGLTRVYLEGALRRTLEPPPHVTPRSADVRPSYAGPAPDAAAPPREAPRAILDPFAVYAQGEEVLRQELSALARVHLINIIRAYDLSERPSTELQRMGEAELADTIAAAVRRRWEATYRDRGD